MRTFAFDEVMADPRIAVVEGELRVAAPPEGTYADRRRLEHVVRNEVERHGLHLATVAHELDYSTFAVAAAGPVW